MKEYISECFPDIPRLETVTNAMVNNCRIIDEVGQPDFYARVLEHPNDGRYFVALTKPAKEGYKLSGCNFPMQTVAEYDNGLKERHDLSPFDKIKTAELEEQVEQAVQWYNDIRLMNPTKSYMIDFGMYKNKDTPVLTDAREFREKYHQDVSNNPIIFTNGDLRPPESYTFNEILAGQFEKSDYPARILHCGGGIGSFMDDKALDFLRQRNTVLLYSKNDS